MKDLLFLFGILICIKYPFYIDKRYGPTLGRRRVFVYLFILSEIYLFYYASMLILQVVYDNKIFTYGLYGYFPIAVLGGMFIGVLLIRVMGWFLLHTSKTYLFRSFRWSSFVTLATLITVGIMIAPTLM